VVGFALGWEGQAHRTLWITGDTVLYDGVRQVADRLQVDTALLHLGCVRFPVTGPVRYSMDAREAVELCRWSAPAPSSPVHYEGWTHFRQGRGCHQQQFEQAPADIGRRLQWLPIGASIGIAG
jgi:L-ascorbate metabolism protein UlaG (beta-lactamase superfamily)